MMPDTDLPELDLSIVTVVMDDDGQIVVRHDGVGEATVIGMLAVAHQLMLNDKLGFSVGDDDDDD